MYTTMVSPNPGGRGAAISILEFLRFANIRVHVIRVGFFFRLEQNKKVVRANE
jgi:hypothetical protein